MPRSQNKYSIGIGYILFIAGSSLTVWLASGFWQGLHTQDWLAEPAIIYQSKVIEETRQGSDGLFSHHLSYRYEHSGMTFTGNRVYAKELPLVSSKLVERRQAEYPVGSIQTVYVDPNRPTDAVLIRGVSLDLILALVVALAFSLVGVLTIKKAR